MYLTKTIAFLLYLIDYCLKHVGNETAAHLYSRAGSPPGSKGGLQFRGPPKKTFTPGAYYQPGVKVNLYSRWGDGTESKGAWHIYTTAIFFLVFFTDSSPPAPTPLGRPHRGRRRHPARRRSSPPPRARPRSPCHPARRRPRGATVARTPPLDTWPHRYRTYPRRVDTARRRGRQRARGFLSSIPKVRCLLRSISRLHRDQQIDDEEHAVLARIRPIPSPCMKHTVLGKFTHGNRTYCCSRFLFLRACSSIDTVATETLVVTLVCIRTYINKCVYRSQTQTYT